MIILLLLQFFICTSNSSGAVRKLLRPNIDDNEQVRKEHNNQIQSYYAFRTNANKWKPWPYKTKMVPDVKNKEKFKAKYSYPPRSPPIQIPLEYQNSGRINHFGKYQVTHETTQGIAYKAIGVRDESVYDYSVGLIPDTVREDGNEDRSQRYFTPWYFSRVALSQKDAIKARKNALDPNEIQREDASTIVVKVDLNKYNEWIYGSSWPHLEIRKFFSGFHIVPSNIRSNWQIPPWCLEVREITNLGIKVIAETIKPMETFAEYARNYDQQVENGLCDKYEVYTLEHRWCMTQGDFIGGLVM